MNDEGATKINPSQMRDEQTVLVYAAEILSQNGALRGDGVKRRAPILTPSGWKIE
jgi:hypothetical protein